MPIHSHHDSHLEQEMGQSLHPQAKSDPNCKVEEITRSRPHHSTHEVMKFNLVDQSIYRYIESHCKFFFIVSYYSLHPCLHHPNMFGIIRYVDQILLRLLEHNECHILNFYLFFILQIPSLPSSPKDHRDP